MAAAKKNSTKPKTQLKSNDLTGNNKRMALILLAFAVVGVVVLIRSFADSVVVSLNPGNALTSTPGLTNQNATVVSETVTDGKKTNTVNAVELTSGKGLVPATLVYTFKPNAGDYQGCFTVKPTVAKSFGHIEVHATSASTSSEYWRVQEATLANPSYISFTLNVPKEICTNFTVPTNMAGKDYQIAFGSESPDNILTTPSTWRVSNITVRLGVGNNASLL